MNIDKFNKYGLQPKDLINYLNRINNEKELKEFAVMYNIDEKDLSDLSGVWQWVKEKVIQPVGGAIKGAFSPVKEAIGQRVQSEIDLAGRRLAQQIYPQGNYLPQPQVQLQPSFDWNSVVKYIPYILFAYIVVNIIKSKKK